MKILRNARRIFLYAVFLSSDWEGKKQSTNQARFHAAENQPESSVRILHRDLFHGLKD